MIYKFRDQDDTTKQNKFEDLNGQFASVETGIIRK